MVGLSGTVGLNPSTSIFMVSTGIHPNEPSYHRFKLPLLSCAKGWLYSTSEPVSSLCQVCGSVGWVISPSCTFCPSRNVLQLELELKLHCLRAVVHNGPFLRARSLSRRRRDASSPGVFAAVIAVDQTAGLAMNHYLQWEVLTVIPPPHSALAEKRESSYHHSPALALGFLIMPTPLGQNPTLSGLMNEDNVQHEFIRPIKKLQQKI